MTAIARNRCQNDFLSLSRMLICDISDGDDALIARDEGLICGFSTSRAVVKAEASDASVFAPYNRLDQIHWR